MWIHVNTPVASDDPGDATVEHSVSVDTDSISALYIKPGVGSASIMAALKGGKTLRLFTTHSEHDNPETGLGAAMRLKEEITDLFQHGCKHLNLSKLNWGDVPVSVPNEIRCKYKFYGSERASA